MDLSHWELPDIPRGNLLGRWQLINLLLEDIEDQLVFLAFGEDPALQLL